MLRTSLLTCVLLGLVGTIALTDVAVAAKPAKLSATAIVEKNIEARGGVDRWREIQTVSWSGKLEAGSKHERPIKVPGMPKQTTTPDLNEQVQLPFVLEMARPRMSRLEVEFAGQTAIQVYDGEHGWKLRPFLNRLEVESYTADELKASESQSDLDGMLIDYKAKGTKIELAGIEPVEGRDAYKLKLTLANGHVIHDWVDAETFLEVKIEGTPRKLDGQMHDVVVYLRDYKGVDGVQIPHLLETEVQGIQRTEKIQIEKVVLNPRLEDSRFEKPTI
jgi:outer membrane lipoprotein-sorting protein